MSIILPKASLQSFPNAPASASAHFSVESGGPKLEVYVSVNDRALRAAIGQSFDGLEQPFVTVEDSAGRKNRVMLRYQGSVQASGMRPTVDAYKVTLFGGQVDPTAAMTRGVEFGFLTNVGEVELQNPGETWPLI